MSHNKATPKSCSCAQCKRGKGTTAGKQRMKLDERAHRHASNLATRQGREVLPPPGPVGNYFD
jgi:hypothetical protein